MMNRPCKNARTLNVTPSGFVGQKAVIMALEFKPAQQVGRSELDHSIKVAPFE
jgi:hypothetical protein